MTTIELFEKLYRDGSPALKQRLDDLLVGATIAMKEKDGAPHQDQDQDNKKEQK